MTAQIEKFDQSTLKELYDYIPLTPEETQYLLDYYQGIAHAYGMIPIEKVWDIIQSQTGQRFTQLQLAQFSKVVRHEDVGFSLLGEEDLYEGGEESSPEKRSLCGKVLLEAPVEWFRNLRLTHKAHDFYLLEQEELLRHKEKNYAKDTPEKQEFLAFFNGLDPVKAQERLGELVQLLRWGEREDFGLLDFVESLEMTMAQGNEYLRLYHNFSQHLSLPILWGRSPQELEDEKGDKEEETVALGQNIRRALMEGMMDEEVVRDRISNMDVTETQRAGLYQQLEDVLKEKNLKIVGEADGTLVLDLPSPLSFGGSHQGKTGVSRNQPCPCGSGKKYKRCCGV